MRKLKLRYFVAIAIIIFSFVSFSYLTSYLFKKETTEQNLSLYKDELNKSIQSSSLNGVIEKPVTLKGKALSFNYQIPAISIDKINDSGLAEFNQDIYQKNISNICTLKNLLNGGASFDFVYFDVNNIEFSRVHIEKKDCE